MKLVTAFIRLIRWPNLVFIALTQILFVYCILQPLFINAGIESIVHGSTFILLTISSVLIAAAGYIINDYFDLNIDQINKPSKLIVEKIIHRRWTIIWHLLLSTIGIIIGFYLDITTHVSFLGVCNILSVALLFLYSISLKKKLLVGNIVISLLTSWVILVIAWCEFFRIEHAASAALTAHILRITFLYAGFAFIISLIREVIKDMEDIDGDRKYGCLTMPIVWGMHASKIFTAVWLIVLITLLTILQVYVLQFGWWLSSLYCFILIIAPLIFTFKKLFNASAPSDFHTLSSIVKLIMFTGILSMIFFNFYN